MNKFEWASIAVIALTLGLSAWAWPMLPNSVASHWNAAGQVDGYSPKLVALLLAPVISAALLALFAWLPSVDPLRKNYRHFQPQLDGFKLAIVVFMAYIHALVIAYNLGGQFPFTAAMAPAFALLFWQLGELCYSSRRNWFFGVRTPWALSSDRVWEKTHKLAGKVLKACAVISLLGIAFQGMWFVLVLGPVMAALVAAAAVSYLEFKKEQRPRKRRG